MERRGLSACILLPSGGTRDLGRAGEASGLFGMDGAEDALGWEGLDLAEVGAVAAALGWLGRASAG